MIELRRPRKSTIGALIIFIISFGFWLTQPQPDNSSNSVNFPDVSWVFVTTTVPGPVETIPETTVPVTVPPETVPPETLPPETTVPPDAATTTVPG